MKTTIKFWGLALAAAMGFALAGCTQSTNPGPVTVSVTGVSVNKTELTLVVGESAPLTATVRPINAANKEVSWTSSDQKIATVDDGVVTAVAAGTATITVTTADGGKTAECEVTVQAAPSTDVAVTGVILNRSALNLVIGGVETLIATVRPSNADNTAVTWTSSDSNIAAVDNGAVTAVAAGTATITVTTADGGKTADCIVTVRDPASKGPAVTGISLSRSVLNLTQGTSETLFATIRPGNAANKDVLWASSDSAIAAVDTNGVVTAHAPGTAVITATAIDGGRMATCTVNVSFTPVTNINSVPAAASVGVPLILSGTVAPANASYKTIAWSVQSGAADITGNTLTSDTVGTVVVTATIANGAAYGEAYTQDFTVTVGSFVAVTDITNTPFLATVGTSRALSATAVPADASIKTIVWSLKNSGGTGAGITSDKYFTATAAGAATVTATIVDGVAKGVDFTKDFTVIVQKKEVSFNIFTDSDVTISGALNVSQSNPAWPVITIDHPGQFSSINWYLNGIHRSGASLQLEADNAAYNSLGQHIITVEVIKDGVPYSKAITVTVGL